MVTLLKQGPVPLALFICRTGGQDLSPLFGTCPPCSKKGLPRKTALVSSFYSAV